MNTIVDVSVIPIGVGVSLSEYVAVCQRVFQGAGLKIQLHSNGTNVEGDWDVVFSAIKICHEEIHRMGAPRIATTIRLGTRIDRDQTLEEKLTSVQEKLDP